ncbi:D-isomer specific 2-hydroxyacid dehydrogenase, NAD-binding [Penicillium occitanis (nom. inval.)]|nr:hypothetical protein PENOC_069610 [Penicillium occitanis (nom. inval.)]PCG98332.1 D-isomer specific 2-hydroxyacid dehydrogenase, NAD-binding [Penicillium occitanis (nom. inval.)]
MPEHLLVTLPSPRLEDLLEKIRVARPDLKISFIRHEVYPTDAFFQRDMVIPDGDITALFTMGYVPKPAQAPRLRYIHFNVSGIDHVAHEEVFRDPNITITTSTGAPAIAVAEWVFGVLLAHYRQLFTFKEWQNNSTWGRLGANTPTSSLDGKRMGIVGYGTIGRQVARVAQALGIDVVVYTSKPRMTAAERRDNNSFVQSGSGDPDGTVPSQYFHGQTKADFQHFLSQDLDILVLALPLTPATRHLVGEDELRILNGKAGAYLVNVSRGAIVDRDVLLESLQKGAGNGGLQGAALDVTDPEPLPSDSELWTAPNIFISPHISSITPQTAGRSYAILAENLKRQARGENLLNVVKAPESSLSNTN